MKRIPWSTALLARALGLLAILLSEGASASPDIQEVPLSMDLVDANAEEVLRSFGTMADAEVSIDDQIRGKVTILLNDVHWMTALDAVCESVGCRWILESGFPRHLKFQMAQPPPSGPEPQPLTEPLTLSLRDAKVRKVLESFGEILQREVSFDGPFKATVSLELQDVTLQTALTAVCQSAGCRWGLVDGRLLVTGKAPAEPESEARDQLRARLSLSLADAPVSAVLGSYAKILGVPLDLAPDVEGQITVELKDAPAEDALNEVCSRVGCRWRLEGEPGAEVLVVEAAAGG